MLLINTRDGCAVRSHVQLQHHFSVQAERAFFFPPATSRGSLEQSRGIGITTRRSLLQNAALSAAAAITVPAFGNVGKHSGNAGSSPLSFANLIDHPTSVTVLLEDKNALQLERTGDTWRNGNCTLNATPTARGLSLSLVASSASVLHVHVRWQVASPAAKLRVLGDAWERSYGELGWNEFCGSMCVTEAKGSNSASVTSPWQRSWFAQKRRGWRDGLLTAQRCAELFRICDELRARGNTGIRRAQSAMEPEIGGVS